MSTSVVSIDRSKYRMVVRSGTHQFLADEPGELGGTDLGPSPDNLLTAALGACTAATLRMYADRKGWNLQGVEVEVSIERNAPPGVTEFRRIIRLKGELDESQQARLLDVAERCPVHRVLSNSNHINTTHKPDQINT